MSNNDTDDRPISEVDGWRLFLAVNAIFISVLAVTFNTVLALVIAQTRSLRTPTNTFIISLAVGEMFIGLFHVPFVSSSLLANGWPFSRVMCRASGSLQVIGRTVVTFSLMSVCLDRCVAVSRPIMYTHIMTFKFAATMLCSLWLLALIVGVLPLGSWGSYQYSGTFSACIMQQRAGSSQHLVREFICTFAPIFVILTCLLIIIREVKYHHRVFALFPVPTAPVVAASGSVTIPGFMPGLRGFNRNTMKALRPLFILCLIHGVFSLPATGLYLSIQRVSFPGSHPGHCVVVWLSLLSCFLNPLVIILFKQKFRTRVKSILNTYLRFWTLTKQHKEPFTISTGLQGILLETTLIGNMSKTATTTTSAAAAAIKRGQSTIRPSVVR